MGNPRPCPDPRARAFGASVLAHSGDVFTLARRLTGSDADAEDVAQEALLRAWRYFESFRSGPILPWLEAIVRNTHRTWRARTERAAGPSHPRSRAIQPEAIARVALREAIAALPAEPRAAFVCLAVAGLSGSEAAARLRVPRSVVYARLQRAKLDLRKALRGFR